MEENYDKILKSYKKRERSLQRRISLEQNVNKRMYLLLSNCEVALEPGALKDLITHELNMLKYKYY